MPLPFFTIGHATRSIEEFVALLRESGVTFVADVRTVPRSRTNPQYNREGLEELRVPPIRKRNDFALWLKILHTVPKVYGLQEPLAVYRVRKSSVSSNKKKLIAYQWKLYRQIEGLGVARSSLAMAGVFWCKLTHPTWHEHR